MGCGVYWQQIREVERALGSLRRLGIMEGSPAFGELMRIRGKLLRNVGVKFPRSVSQIAKIIGLSPGIITLWHDVESGWMTEGRIKPGAPPVYRAASDEVAVRIINGDIDHELEDVLMTPDPFIGN